VEPHWPPGAEPQCGGGGGGGRHLGPPRGWVRNLFTSISRYMRPFFFFPFHYHSLVNPSINRSDYKATGCRRGGKGDVYVYVSCCGRTDGTASSWDGPTNRFRGGCSPSGGSAWCGGRAGGGGALSEAGGHKLGRKWGDVGRGWGQCGPALGASPACPGATSGTGTANLAASSAQEGGQALWEEKALRVNKAKTSRVIAEPTLAHVCEERRGVRN